MNLYQDKLNPNTYVSLDKEFQVHFRDSQWVFEVDNMLVHYTNRDVLCLKHRVTLVDDPVYEVYKALYGTTSGDDIVVELNSQGEVRVVRDKPMASDPANSVYYTRTSDASEDAHQIAKSLFNA